MPGAWFAACRSCALGPVANWRASPTLAAFRGPTTGADMTGTDEDVEARVREALGQSDVRMAFSRLTAAGAKLVHRSGELAGFVQSVLRAAFRAQPAAPDGPLREVVAG